MAGGRGRMKAFVTGASGYLGGAIVRALAEAGHDVAGLTRLAEKASYLEALGARPVLGDLRDAGSYGDAAAAADVLVHVALEGSDMRGAVDRMAVEALLAAARPSRDGRPRQLIYTSGCFVLGDTGDGPAHEDASTAGAPDYAAWRVPHEQLVLAAGRPELTTAVIRPGMVYGGRDGAFARFFATAEADGAAEFVGDGANRWSPVHRSDVGRLYALVAESRASGIFHCAEGAARVGDLAVAASRAAGAGGATRRLRLERARRTMGGLADALTMDQVMGCRRSEGLGWAPAHPPFRESAASVFREFRPTSGS